MNLKNNKPRVGTTQERRQGAILHPELGTIVYDIESGNVQEATRAKAEALDQIDRTFLKNGAVKLKLEELQSVDFSTWCVIAVDLDTIQLSVAKFNSLEEVQGYNACAPRDTELVCYSMRMT